MLVYNDNSNNIIQNLENENENINVEVYDLSSEELLDNSKFTNGRVL